MAVAVVRRKKMASEPESQFTSGAFTGLPDDNGIAIGMDGRSRNLSQRRASSRKREK